MGDNVPSPQEAMEEEGITGLGSSNAPQEEHVIDVPTLQPASTYQNDEFKETCLPLYRAALKGDWATAKSILDKNPDAIRAKITAGSHTVLHVAAASGHVSFVKNLVMGRMTNEDLALKNNEGVTALMLAVTSGYVEVAKVLIEKDRSLAVLQLPESQRAARARPVVDGQDIMLRTPINLATLYGRQEMVHFLYKSIDVFDDSQLHKQDRNALFVNTIKMGIYDVALDMVKRHPRLATAKDYNGWTALHALAYKPKRSSYFPNSSPRAIWDQFIIQCNLLGTKDLSQQRELELLKLLWKQIHASLEVSEIKQLVTQPYPLQIAAALHGNVDFLTILTDFFPDLILMGDAQGRSLFHVAVQSRQEDIFKLIYKFGSLKDAVACRVDPEGNTMLHYAALLPPPHRLNSTVSGAALQLQRELIWFEEVRHVVPLYHEDYMNHNGQTAQEVFRDTHKKLMEEGEKWMKDTANSCMLVAALIATVVFAVAFTVPAGNIDDVPPVYLRKMSFEVFSILDAISLVSSSTSILTFLSILTARYTEEDFLWSLPSKLFVGLLTLYISIIAMMGAFGAAYFIIFEGIVGVAAAVAAATCIPVMWYALMLRHVFVDVFRSTFMAGSLFGSSHVP